MPLHCSILIANSGCFLQPRENVAIQVTASGATYGFPLTDPRNAAFAGDLISWGKLTEQLYIWDYSVDAGNYLQPWPNYYTVGETLPSRACVLFHCPSWLRCCLCLVRVRHCLWLVFPLSFLTITVPNLCHMFSLP